MLPSQNHRFWRTVAECLFATIALAVLTFAAFRLHATTAMAALLFFFFIVLTSLWARFLAAVFACILAVLCFNYFFAPPLFDLRVRDSQDIARVIAFSTTGLVISLLMSRVRGQTSELKQTNEQLRAEIVERKRAEEAYYKAQAELARVTRITAMGELAASIAHEVNQPIAAAITNANTCLRWLTRDHPDVEEARAAAMRIVKDGTHAAEIISRVRQLFKKGTAQRELVDVNELIREMIVLLRTDTTRYNIFVGTDLAADLPQVMGDRVQLQQVLMNLMINGIDAMKDVAGTRELVIKSWQAENEEVVVSVTDTGVGLPPEQAEQIFSAFFTTKAHGTGMGLRVSRSIIESHGGRLWAADNSRRGASFCFTLPAKAEARACASNRA
jgi:C4-dicarboxylate-specific signal transduction histidine kinase